MDTERPLPAHQALIRHSDHDLVTAAVPFLRDGLADGVAVIAVLAPEGQALLRDTLGADGDRIQWFDIAGWYSAAPHALGRALRLADGSPDGVRLLGEAGWPARSPAEVTAWAHYESLINVALPRTPALCVYDATTLDPAVVATAAQTHPVLSVPGPDGALVTRASPAFVDPATYLATADTDPLPAPPERARPVRFGPADLPAVRALATTTAEDAGLDRERVDDLVTAVNEAATNAVESGGLGVLRVWTDPAGIVCEVVNAGGPIADPFAGHFPPDPLGARGRGLWLMRQLTDLVEIRSTAATTAVRLHTLI